MSLINEGCDEFSLTERLETSSLRSANASMGGFPTLDHFFTEMSFIVFVVHDIDKAAESLKLV